MIANMLVFFHMCFAGGGKVKWSGKLFCLVEKKNEDIKWCLYVRNLVPNRDG